MTTDTANGDNNKEMEKYFFRASAQDFNKIPAKPIAYWASERILSIFANNIALKNVIETREGLTTGSNDLFLRLWHEVPFKAIGIHFLDQKQAARSNKRYFTYVKGGEYRRWSGNFEYVVNWYRDGEELRDFKDVKTGRVRSHNYNGEYAFREGFTWSGITSGNFAARYVPQGFMFDAKGPMGFVHEGIDKHVTLAFLNSSVASFILKMIAPTLDFKLGHILSLPYWDIDNNTASLNSISCIDQSKVNWDSYETSWDFTSLPLLQPNYRQTTLAATYQSLRAHWQENTLEMQRLEEENNRIFIEAYGLEDELTPEVPLNEITLTCNPHYRYRLGKQWDEASEEERNAELERQLQSDTICELISYIIGCMMGRYSIDQPGLILASQGETLKDYFQRVPSPRFIPDDDAIVPLTDQEWFEDDATHRVREFVRTVWGDQHLQENLDFIAESLCLSAMRPRKGESSLDCIRRYLSTQFYKDHMRTYKKRPIYWLFSSGRLKAFECLVYLHRYNEGTLSRMRTDYVIPLTAKLYSYAERLESEKENSTTTAETRRLEKEIDQLHKQQAELAAFDEQLRDFADQRIQLDLDDGVKINYGKFGNLLADVKAITG